jgi:hypothetical protein
MGATCHALAGVLFCRSARYRQRPIAHPPGGPSACRLPRDPRTYQVTIPPFLLPYTTEIDMNPTCPSGRRDLRPDVHGLTAKLATSSSKNDPQSCPLWHEARHSHRHEVWQGDRPPRHAARDQPAYPCPGAGDTLGVSGMRDLVLAREAPSAPGRSPPRGPSRDADPGHGYAICGPSAPPKRDPRGRLLELPYWRHRGWKQLNEAGYGGGGHLIRRCARDGCRGFALTKSMLCRHHDLAHRQRRLNQVRTGKGKPPTHAGCIVPT